MLNHIKDWWHALWVEHYELTVWFEDQTVTNLEDNTTTTTRSKKTFDLKSISKKTQNHIIGVDINDNPIEIKTTKPFDFQIIKKY
tara:strand:- start:410 stop:664 length:255 start_codon:yes stop_codon:yes gene_type:complete